jgi:hypothetical protein
MDRGESSLRLMRGKAAPIALAVLAIAIAGCGESQPKRAVDARTEALRFFSVDAPAVALLRPEPPAALVALDNAADGVPAWTGFRSLVFGPLQAAGLGRAQLARLVRPSEEIEGLDAAAFALGAATPADLAAHRPLLVLATDQAELLSRLLRRAAARGQLQHAGRLDEALLYRSPGASFAARDGVLVSAPRLADVRAAIQRRDGDSDRQLDEDVVRSLFDDLEEQGPLLVYAELARVREADPGLETLARQAPWTGMLGQTAATARSVRGALQIEDLSKAPGGDLSSAELPIGTAPSRFTITESTVDSLIPQPGSVRTLLGSLAPITGDATATSDEVRLHVTVAP